MSSSAPTSPFTPPKSARIRNPFEKSILDNLHRPICSPDMFRVPPRKESNGPFEWDLKEVAILKPADIDESAGQSDPSPDPITRQKAHTAIKKFFSQGVLPSPMDQTPKVAPLLKLRSGSTQYQREVTKREGYAQTTLTLPPVLPPELEALLEPYFTYTGKFSSCDFDTSSSVSYIFGTIEEEDFNKEPIEPLVEIMKLMYSSDHGSQSENYLINGMSRSFGTPKSKIYSVQQPSGEKHHRQFGCQPISPEFSPILYDKQGSTRERSRGEADNLSPIKLEDEERISAIRMPSYKDNDNFCGSTPEKSIMTTYHASLSPVRFKQRISNFSKSGKGEPTLNRSKSVVKLDFSMDMSVDTSMTSNSDKSLRSHSVPGAASESCNSSPLAKQEFWKMDMSSSIQDLSKQTDIARKCDTLEYKFSKPDVVKINKMPVIRSVDDHHYEIKDTPIKGKAKNVLLLDKVFDRVFQEKKSFHQNVESPMQMSFDNSFDDNFESVPEHSHFKSESFSSLITSQINIQACMRQNVEKTCEASESYKRLDSGLGNETSYFGKSSYQDDLTKSHCNIDENWRRIDSGFTDDTSTDLHKQKENVHPSAQQHESLSMSDIFSDGIIKFSSTPSKSKLLRH